MVKKIKKVKYRRTKKCPLNLPRQGLLNVYQTIAGFNDRKKKPFENTVGKGEVTSIFSFSHSLFYPTVSKTSQTFEWHLFCRLQMLST